MRADAEIVRETLAGEREAFSELVERHYPLIFGLALSSLRNRDDAEDAAQESFLRALKSLNTLKEPARFASWLSSIVRNICRDYRARQLSEQHVAHLAAETPHEPSEPDGNDLHELLWDHVMALPPDEREILILYYFSKQNTRAIAELISISIPAAEKRLQRARQSLGTRMEAALNETMESRGPSTRSVERTAQAVIAAPVMWKTVTTGGAIGVTGNVTSVVGSWKSIAVLSGVIALSISIPLAIIAPQSLERSYVATGETSGKGVAIEEVDISVSSTNETSTPSRFLPAIVQDDRPGVLVVDAGDQTPIKGAQVTLITQSKALRETTDSKGIARFAVSPSEGVRIKLLHENYLPRKDVPATFNGNSLQTVALDPPGRLRGRVVDAKTRAAVTDYKIYIRGKYGEVSPNWQRDSERHIHESGGRFEAEGVNKGSVTVTAFGYANAFTHFDASEGEIEIALYSDYSLDVTVTDGVGKPVENVDILIASTTYDSTGVEFHKESGRNKGGTTDGGGKVRIEHLLSRPYDIAIRDPRFFPMSYTIDKNLEGPVIPVSLVVIQTGGVEGVVRYGSAPASDVTVSLYLSSLGREYKLQRQFSTQTARDGAFGVDSLPSGLYEYSAHATENEWTQIDMPLITGELTVNPGAIAHHDIVIPIGTASISGRVSLGSAPLANVRVDIGTESGGLTYFRSTRTGNDGTYAIDALLPGEASIYFMHSISFDAVHTEDRFGQSIRRHHPVELATGSNTALDVQFLTGTQLIASVVAPDDARSSINIIRTPRDTAAPKSLRNFAVEAECFGSRELHFESLDAGTYEISIRMFSRTLGNRYGSVSVEIPSSGAAEIELNWEALQPRES